MIAQTKTRIVFVEDGDVVRKAYRALIEATSDVVIVGEAVTVAQARAMLSVTVCDVVLLDLSLPDGSGMDVLAYVQTHHRGLRVIVVSSKAETYARKASEAGAWDVLQKSRVVTHLLELIRAVSAIR